MGAAISVPVLILQAGVEIFVENKAMGTFFSSLGSVSVLSCPVVCCAVLCCAEYSLALV